MEAKKVLIFPAGTEIAFEIHQALKYSKFVSLFGGTSVPNHAEFVFENCIEGFPYIDEINFLSYLNQVIDEYKIDYIYPAHDSVQLFLTQHQSEIKAGIVTSPLKTVTICRSKAETYKYFKGEEFLPKIYEGQEQIEQYPVFIKPSVGQGSIGTIKIENEMELLRVKKQKKDIVICEYLPGVEYTIDCFTDRHGILRLASLRDRQRIRAGISVRSQILPRDDKVMQIAEKINQKLIFSGAWFFQLKKNLNGEYRLMEISPRIPGTMGASRNLGINFPMLTLFNLWGYEINLINNENELLLDRAFINRYQTNIKYNHVYIDFDDTLIVKGKVNINMISFIYQLVNKGKKIYLLTRHAENIEASLKKYKISLKLFDEVIHIADNKKKSEFICYKDSIFIDDSFAERYDVKKSLGIPVFDIDMVESLIDHRM